jgi:hypothetical protein
MSNNNQLFSNVQLKTFFTNQDFQIYSKLRIIQRNLVHFLNFPDSLLNEELLKSKEYFGQFGQITKIMLTSKIDSISKKKSNSAYITFSKNEEAAYAILSIDSIIIEGQLVRCFFGTSKYCIHFLNNMECINKEKCMYVHSLANDSDIIGINSKFGYSEHIKLAKKIINYDSFENENYIMNLNINFTTIFPNVKSIYLKDENVDILKNDSLKSSNSTTFSNSSNKSLNNTLDQNYNYGISDNVNNNYNNNNNNYGFLFKYKDKSRFFHCENKLDNEMEVPERFIHIIDKLSQRIPYFNKYEDLISKKNLEIEFCREKMKIYKDSWLYSICMNCF